jgi:PKD repeat protein
VDVQNATYTFEDPGTHTVALTVEDAAGNTNRDTATVTVTEDQTQQPPTTTVDETTVSTTTSSTTDDYTGGGGIIPSSPSTETSTTTTPAQTTTPATSNTTTTNTPQTTTTVDQTASTESVEPTSRDRSAATSTGMPTGSALDEGGVGGRGESSPITVRINWVFGLVVGVVGFLGLPLYYLKTGSLIPSSLPVPLLFWMRDEEDEADENDDEDESGPRE